MTFTQALHDTALLAAFIVWFQVKKFVGDPTIIFQQKLTPSLWRAFSRSDEAKPFLPLPPFDGSAKHQGPRTAAQPVAVPVAVPVAATDPVPQPEPVKCTTCGNVFGLQDPPFPCYACPPAVSVHCRPCCPAPGIAPVSATDPLMALIAQGLQAMGFVAGEAVSAQRCQEIAWEQALDVVQTVIADLEAQGKLGTKPDPQPAPPSIVINEAGKPPVTVSGRVPVWFPRLLKMAHCRVPAFLVGPAGCGKTTAVAMLAQAMGLPFTRVSVTAGIDEGAIQGHLLPVEIGGRFVYVPAPAVERYEQGGVLLIDELDTGDANMLCILSAVLDNGGWHIPIRHGQPQLVKHKDFIVVANANTYGHGADRLFVGANRLDERTLSRLRMGQIACDYDEDLEKEQFDTTVVEFGHRLRIRCRAIAEFGHDVSTRDIESADKMLAQFEQDEVWYGYFSDWDIDELARVHALVDHTACTVVLA